LSCCLLDQCGGCAELSLTDMEAYQQKLLDDIVRRVGSGMLPARSVSRSSLQPEEPRTPTSAMHPHRRGHRLSPAFDDDDSLLDEASFSRSRGARKEAGRARSRSRSRSAHRRRHAAPAMNGAYPARSRSIEARPHARRPSSRYASVRCLLRAVMCCELPPHFCACCVLCAAHV
jgi:hypothetical protein